MDINALKTFLQVSKTLHFGHAAEDLSVSQSTVSARIRALEEHLGAELFIRQRGNIHLSPSGEALVSHAKSILTLWSRAQHEIAMPDSAANRLVIGGLSGLWDISLQIWLSKISRANPTLVISADVFNNESLVKRILNGSMDIAFLYDAPQGIQLVSQPLKTINLRMVSSQQVDNPAAALELGFINVDWGLGFAVSFAAQFPELLATRLHTGLGRIAFEFLRKNPGSAYLAEPVVADPIANGELFYVPDAPVFKRRAYAIYHSENDRQDLIRSLLTSV